MAQIYVGFHDQRNSSRILKPPGGGTSDIFGTDAAKSKQEELCTPSTPTKENADPNNQITPEKKSDDNATDDKSTLEEPKIENLNISNKENGEKAEDEPSEKKSESKPDTIASIIKQDDPVQSPIVQSEKKTPQRVPPGGYSSGLW